MKQVQRNFLKTQKRNISKEASNVAFPVRKGEETESLREALNKAIDELRTEGKLAEISEKYFGTDITAEN